MHSFGKDEQADIIMRGMALRQLNGYRFAFVAYSFCLLSVFHPYLTGEVTAPHRQAAEVGATQVNLSSPHGENRKFSDYNNAYIPEISEHLIGNRSGWLTLWTNKNELGRPVYQISGFSSVYLPSWVLAQITYDPYRFITLLSLFICFLAGAFVLLFCREISLNPMAGFIAATNLAASPLFMYWLTFPMFPSVLCWSAGALWGVTRLESKSDLLGWSALTFSSYSLLMTAYPQPVVFHAYLLGGYGLYLTYRRQQVAQRKMVHFLALALSALIVGIVLVLPVYRDLAILSAESTRNAPDPSFFTAVLPKFACLADVVRFFVLTTVPEFLGNPIASSFPFSYDGTSVTLLMIFFAVIALLVAFKQTWGWWLALVALFLLALVHPLYVLGIKYLGFNLSRSTPLGSIMLPFTVIMAHGVDALIKRRNPGILLRVTMFATGCLLAVIAVGIGYSLAHTALLRWNMVLVMLMLTGLLAAQYRETRPVLLVAALLTVLVSISYPLMLRQDPTRIAVTSPLVERVRDSVPDGSRFALVAPGMSALPPNLNAGLGLASVHSYNSLSPRRYHTLIEALGGEVLTYGRWNWTISPDYASAMFWMSNISLILSPTRLAHENLRYLGEESGIHLHKVISRMGECLQVQSPQTDIGSDGLHIEDPRLLSRHTPIKLLDEGDLLEFEVTPGPSTLLILSQKYHRDWQARTLVQQDWVPVRTTEVNSVFQGVLVPPDAQRVRLEFKPLSRYSWIAHVFWLFLLALLGIRACQRSKEKACGLLKTG